MKTSSRFLLLSFLALMVTGGVAHAHGLHPNVAPEYHTAAHVGILVGVAALVIGLGVWARRRVRRRRTNSVTGKPS